MWNVDGGVRQAQLQLSVMQLKDSIRQKTPLNPVLWGFKVFSQCDEDGIIERCLDLISEKTPLSKTCIELGCGNGLENNTHYLILRGYRGAWVDGSEQKIGCIEAALGGTKFPRLWVRREFLVRIGPIVLAETAEFLETRTSTSSLGHRRQRPSLRQRVHRDGEAEARVRGVQREVPPAMSLRMDYDERYVWKADDYFGASLGAYMNVLHPYRLVTCNISGVNAFFVREDLAGAFAKYEPDQLYQPARYWAINLLAGHAPSLKWLAQAMRAEPPAG